MRGSRRIAETGVIGSMFTLQSSEPITTGFPSDGAHSASRGNAGLQELPIRQLISGLGSKILCMMAVV